MVRVGRGGAGDVRGLICGRCASGGCAALDGTGGGVYRGLSARAGLGVLLVIVARWTRGARWANTIVVRAVAHGRCGVARGAREL